MFVLKRAKTEDNNITVYKKEMKGGNSLVLSHNTTTRSKMYGFAQCNRIKEKEKKKKK